MSVLANVQIDTCL